MSYAEFLNRKRREFAGVGVSGAVLPAKLYDWQQQITQWGLRKGRAAIFADCGLGKSFMQIAWADVLKVPTLMFAPLCVAEQTIDEAAKLGIRIAYAHDQHEVIERLTITNYERLEKFDPSTFQAVVLDESSILKSMDGKTRTKLIRTFARTPYRLCCTATPSPNDIAELANHAEFLGLMTRAEFLATWFVHDDAGWRMKRHAVQPFYRWLASWAVALRSPRDMGADATGFDLPPLTITDRVVSSSGPMAGNLFPDMGLKGIGGRLAARRESIDARVALAADMARSDEQWIIWCGLNAEAENVAESIGEDAVNVQGSDSHAEKVGALKAFMSGKVRVLVSKLKIAGLGLNLQNCHNMAFLGLSDSYEAYYQGIRRCWRFGQKHPVTAAIIVSDAERGIVANVRRKEADALSLADHLGVYLTRQMEDSCELTETAGR